MDAEGVGLRGVQVVGGLGGGCELVGGAAATARAILAHHGVGGEPLVVALTGSVLYGLADAGSDVDFRGVYVAPTRDMLGLDSTTLHPGSFGTVPNAPRPAGVVDDWMLHEVGQVCRLILSGNPFLLELVYAPPPLVAALPVWTDFFSRPDVRAGFLSQATVRAHVAYVDAALRRHHRGKRLAPKRLYQLLRVLFEARRIAAGAEPHVWLRDADERARLLAVKAGRVPAAELFEEIDDVRRVVLDAAGSLPDAPDERELDAWLVRLRLRAGHTVSPPGDAAQPSPQAGDGGGVPAGGLPAGASEGGDV